MKFKHTFNVLIDNFSVTYKQLLYRLVIWVITACLYTAILYPFVNGLTGSADFANLMNGVKDFLIDLVNGRNTEIAEATQRIKEAFEALLRLIADNRANIAWGFVGVGAVYLVSKFFSGLGNYAAAAVINDKMALRAHSPFMVTLIRNLKPAALYSLIYSPLSLIYDAICYFCAYVIVFRLIAMLPFVIIPLQIFMFVTAVIFIVCVKMTFTSDWLPALIRGKNGQKQAIINSFSRSGKHTFEVMSNFVVLCLLIIAANVGGVIFTFGAAALITIPASYIILVCFEFVNYYDREELKYFIDKNTIIKPEKEKVLTREEFFKGE